MNSDLLNPFELNSTEKIWQCPACEAWQLHCERAVALQWVRMRLGNPTDNVLTREPLMDQGPFAEMIEACLSEHVAKECPHPRLILEMLEHGKGLGL